MELLTDVVQLDLVPVVRAVVKESSRLSAAIEDLAHQVATLRTEVAEGELRQANRLLNALLGQLGCPYERR